MQKRARRGSDEQFRREAVRLAESGTMSIAYVARQIGIAGCADGRARAQPNPAAPRSRVSAPN